MLVSSDFLGYIGQKTEAEKKRGPLVSKTQKASPGGKEKSPPAEQATERAEGRPKEEVEYLNERASIFQAIL
jgi:hypothetical protein